MLLAINALLLFEVMDKEPTLVAIWISSIVLGIGGLILCKYKWWMATIVIAIAVVLALDLLLELHDPFVGPAIIREAGSTYVLQSYIASTISIFLPLLGLILKWRTSS